MNGSIECALIGRVGTEPELKASQVNAVSPPKIAHQTLQDASALPTPQHLMGDCHGAGGNTSDVAGCAYRPTPQHLMCPADGAECEVMAPLMSALIGVCGNGSPDKAAIRLNQSLAEARRWLPCNRCRAATASAARLPKTRLGQRERELLLRAAPAESNTGVLVCDAADPRPLKEAQKRAARKLVRAGLLWTGKRDVVSSRKHPYYEDLIQGLRMYVAVAGLTPFGAEIKQRYLAELQQGHPVRWDERVAESAAAVRQENSASSLLARLEQGVREDASYFMQIVSLVAGAGGNPREYLERYQAADCLLKAITATKPDRAGATT